MRSDYQALLDATIEHLAGRKESGARFISLPPKLLTELASPPTVSSIHQKNGEREPHQVEAIGNRAVGEQVKAAQPNSTAKETAMAELRQRTLACAKCPHLERSRKNVVFGVGDITSPLMFVGEAPGADEDERGEPFVGKAGQLLTKIIQTMGFKRETVYIANVLKCRPDTPGQTAGNRKPTPEEMRTCLPYLMAQIELIQPRVIVALGATAIEGLFGKTEGITRLRGNFQELRGIPVMPTYHPAYLLRNQILSEKRKVWEDMLQVLEKLGRPITEKQRGFFLKAPQTAAD